MVFFRPFRLPLEAQGTHMILISPKSMQEFDSRRRANALSTFKPWTGAVGVALNCAAGLDGPQRPYALTLPEAQPSQPGIFGGTSLAPAFHFLVLLERATFIRWG